MIHRGILMRYPGGGCLFVGFIGIRGWDTRMIFLANGLHKPFDCRRRGSKHYDLRLFILHGGYLLSFGMYFSAEKKCVRLVQRSPVVITQKLRYSTGYEASTFVRMNGLCSSESARFHHIPVSQLS